MFIDALMFIDADLMFMMLFIDADIHTKCLYLCSDNSCDGLRSAYEKIYHFFARKKIELKSPSDTKGQHKRSLKPKG